MNKIMLVFGTRPEAIKMAPVINEIKKNNRFKLINVVTAQHREMLDQVIECFDIPVHYDLDIMKKNQTLSLITALVIERLEEVVGYEKPDMIVVHGDTTTTMAASLVGFYHHIPIAHVEAGLRTNDLYSPFPEEFNRTLVDKISTLHFAPTNRSKENLTEERIDPKKISITGNTSIDVLDLTVTEDYHHPVLEKVNPQNQFILLTTHRRENLGDTLTSIFQVVLDIVNKYQTIEFIFPVHPNPRVSELAYQMLGNQERIHLIEPLNVFDFHNIAKRSFIIMSDSGGIQEEGPSFDKPILVLRDVTERPEGVEAGALKLVGSDKQKILTELERLINDEVYYQKISSVKNPYGDGKASQRIVETIEAYFDQ
ncbi:UDP-N-acetylglucosamine 2-epimerase (non-hydrolyzing) [Enterococcus hirae]|uniref:non-hydrolyzing UDP-N-acetylglucosamine 2-epimerase n=1 Tax=Enterococcus hirae TaxID=1354 RepID=UPI001A024125